MNAKNSSSLLGQFIRFSSCAAISWFFASLGAQGQQYSFVTVAGAFGLSGSADGTGSAARFSNPTGAAIDNAGNVYIADTAGQTIRKITPANVVTTLAGAFGVIGSTNGTGAAARFNYPWGIAVDGVGNVYVGDSDNHLIRKITPAGVVTTLAGHVGVSGSANGTGTAAEFSSLAGIALDAAGNLYVSDYANSTIRKVTQAGVVTTLAGTPGVFSNADGVGAAASFYYPVGIALDVSGNVYVADSNNNSIRKITPGGTVSTLAGSGSPLLPGSVDGTGASARFNAPAGVAVDASGNIFVTDRGNYSIRSITSAGDVATIGGTVGVPGSHDGPGATASFVYPTAITVGGYNNLYIVDTFNQTVRKGWLVVANSASADFNRDGQTDVLWQNTVTGQRALWLMNGIQNGFTPASIVDLGMVATSWSLAGTGDFNADGQADILWQNTVTGQRALWLMNGIQSGFTPASIVDLGMVDLSWSIVGAGDFNADGQTDILWQNTATGQRALWLMNGIQNGFTPSSIVDLGIVATSWSLAGTGDFNGDGQADILWQNTVTGQRALWLMNGIQSGFTAASIVDLGYVETNWSIAGTGDFNADGQADILWQNTATGQRALWLMNGIQGGFTPASIVNLGIVTTDWEIAN